MIVLTYNEEANIAAAIDSVRGWARDVTIVDSGSVDSTVDIARARGCRVVVHAFENYSRQRNFALSLPGLAQWILFLDADERLTRDVRREIDARLDAGPAECGFLLTFRLWWMGKQIRHGYSSTWILRLVRSGYAVCDDRGVNEHIMVRGLVGYIRSPFDHDDRKELTRWVDRHNRYATLEAQRLYTGESQATRGSLFAGPIARRQWIRHYCWRRLPPLLRPFVYFIYRYVLRGGFLDGKAGFIFHFLQALWFQLLIDVKYLEMRRTPPSLPDPAPMQEPL